MRTVSVVCLVALFIGSGFSLQAQEKGGKKDKMENRERKHDRVKQLKVAFFTEKLELTLAESEKFWPVYHEMEDKLEALRKESHKQIKTMEDAFEKGNENELKQGMSTIFSNETKEVEVKKAYYDKLGAVVGYKKATHSFKLEKEFRKFLLKELKDRPGPPPHGGHPPRE